jgi:hypothetical protein
LIRLAGASHRVTIDQPIVPRVVKGALAAGAALLLYFVWRSLWWPLIHDTALMHYIGWLIGAGAKARRWSRSRGISRRPWLLIWPMKTSLL